MPRLDDGSFDQLWFVQNLQTKLKTAVVKSIQDHPDKNYKEVIIDLMAREAIPFMIESQANIKRRARAFQQSLV